MTMHFTGPRGCLVLLLLVITGCGPVEEQATEKGSRPRLFDRLSPDSTGITFANLLTETEDVNYFSYQYAYNGGGVAIGDIDNDGLPDIYFTGNQQADRLYRNLGGLRFEDITERAIGPSDRGWRTGVTMADVDADGHLDIHVCRSGPGQDTSLTRDLLYMNNGDGTFREAAHQWGLADTSHATQATFFDMDVDGDLDMYLLVHPPERVRGHSNFSALAAVKAHTAPTDRLYRNDGDRFTDVTYAANVQNFSFGLGVVASDLDRDGRQDIYVANDFDVPDLMYMNAGEGRFMEQAQARTRHHSWFSMGCDIADYDNDARPDIMVVDMVAEDHERSKTNMGSMSRDQFWMLVRGGYFFQYMANTLQRNNGNGTFSDVGQFAGVARTDWSWAPLFADLDNDGWKDLLVTNGFKRDIRNNDYQQQVYDSLKSAAAFFRTLDLVPSTRLRNYLFRNRGDLTFADSSLAWGFDEAVNSNGAAYADLDGDGDLDLVINNLDEAASIFRNNADLLHPENRSLRLELKPLKGRTAIGAQITLRAGGQVQYLELAPTRGYQSSVEPVLHFGLGTVGQVDELEVLWPGSTGHERTLLRNIKAEGRMVLDQADAVAYKPGSNEDDELFTEVTAIVGPNWNHEEDPYDDFVLEVLLPHQLSLLGPMLTVGDANADGREDVFVGGAHGQPSRLFLQKADGGFVAGPSQPWARYADQEHLGGCFFDADGDGDEDLLVLAGSNQHDLRSAVFTQRLFLNHAGKFTEAPEALPPIVTSAQRAAAADIDGDGDMDLFIGGRLTPAHYPFAPRSYLLINDGQGRFSDGTEQRAPDAMGPGMVTAVHFADIDGDGDPDLLLAGEWMHPMVLRNVGGRFQDASVEMGLSEARGWWSALTTADVDGDGTMDIIAGNLGTNSKYKATPEHPVHIYWADFDHNGRSDIVLAKEKGGTLLPVRGRECSSEQCPMIVRKFPTYEEFAHADLQAIYGPEELASALHLTATEMRSTVFLNRKGSFTARPLPPQAQLAPINGIVTMDVNNDGHLDLVLAGNNWSAEVETVRYDAGTGLVLLGDGAGGFTPLDVPTSGFFAWNNCKDIALLQGRDGPLIMVANNDGPLQTFRLERRATSLSAK